MKRGRTNPTLKSLTVSFFRFGQYGEETKLSSRINTLHWVAASSSASSGPQTPGGHMAVGATDRAGGPASHATHVADGDEKGSLYPPTNAETLHVPMEVKQPTNQRAPGVHSTSATTTSGTRETS
uniref:Uncharacterized protein n=2 Tax=Glossina palpalis gambiensis TaxID=67801 RepID=A0A1B0C5V2_9MUSC